MSSPLESSLAASVAQQLRLALVPGIGPRIYHKLLEQFGTAEQVFAAPSGELRSVPGVGEKLCRAIQRGATEIDVAAELELCRRHDIAVLARENPAYPRLLREIYDPPGILFAQGALTPADSLAIGIVGARHATHYGLAQAERLAASLARAGLTIVSGLARGIDSAAHRGALGAGGRTIAVLGSGLLNLYPPENGELAAEIARQGAVLSEAPPRAEPRTGSFPQRNRLISGLSLGVIVVEASTTSGSLITARLAAEQGREVFAVPGRVDSRVSQGCHRLLRDGAKLVESADDVLEELGPLVERTSAADGRSVHHPAELQLNETEQQVLAAIGDETISIDAVVAGCGLATPQVLATLSALEIRRLVRRVSGSSVRRW
ncbi:MAG: DNA-protecting protein DprA [Planctomycetaceae bacterium]|nr:DNA-protecting protein DprA [Planctomycetaceae bacterium]